METEHADANWSEDMRSALMNDLYSTAIPHTVVQETHCASTLCEVTLQHDQPIDRNSVPQIVGGRQLFAAGAFYQHDNDTNRTTIFVARAGHELFGRDIPSQ